MTDADIAGMSVQNFCRGVLRSRDYRRSLLLRVRIGELPPAIESLLYHYAEGKPVDRIEHTGREGGPIEIRDMTNAELAAKAAALATEAAALVRE